MSRCFQWWMVSLLFVAPVANAVELDQRFSLGFATNADLSTITHSYMVHSQWKWFFVGGGLRNTHQIAYKTLNLTSADATRVRNDNTTTFDAFRVTPHSVNLAASLGARLPFGFRIGMNIDLVGFSYAGVVDGSSSVDGPRRGRASPFNLLLGGVNDIGNLNSEFYVAWDINEKWHIRTGLSHLFTEINLDQELSNGERRFRAISDLFFVAVGFHWSK